MSTSCPLCGVVDYEVMYDLRRVRTPRSIPGLIARCRWCPMWFKILSEGENLFNAYQQDYADSEATAKYMLSEAARSVYRRVLAEISISGKGRRPRLLDIGTGAGALLEEAHRLGFEAEGIDLCEPLVKRAQARGLHVRCLPAEQLADGEPFDVITILDLIEHLPQPLAMLAAARRLLRAGGELVVYTPNHRGAVVLLARLLHSVGLGFAVNEIFGSCHVCFFDDRSLPSALRKAGFERPVGEIVSLRPPPAGAARVARRPSCGDCGGMDRQAL